MKDPVILRRLDTLSPEEAGYWKDLLYRTIKIGTELEFAPPKGIVRPSFEMDVNHALNPSGSLERLGENGVLDVKAEHCGIEIRIIGRYPHFRALHQQYTRIINILLEKGARPRATCGLHFHVLSPALAEPVPEIILANIWSLVRRYAPELKFLTSTGKHRESLCRRRNHNSHLELIDLSPAVMSMAEIQHKLRVSKRVPEHQNFLNLEHLGFLEDGAVLPFHLEFRFPDVELSQTSITAKTFLFMALILKAVNLSQYGILHVGRTDAWHRKIMILNLLSNNEGNLATSDTSAITDEIIEELRQGSFELLDLLEPVFDRFEDNPSLDILLALAEQPISLMRVAGYNWKELEEILAKRAVTDSTGLDTTDRRLMQGIELGEWSGQPYPEAWQWHAARELFLTPQDLERRLQKISDLRDVRWNARQGAMAFYR